MTLLIIGFGCWALSSLLSGFVSPLPTPRKIFTESPMVLAERIAAQTLFGNSLQADISALTSAGQSLHLLGVLSSSQSHGARAIVRQDDSDKTWVLAIGEELLSGAKVTRIEARQITLSSMGRESTLSLPKPLALPSNTDKN